MVRTGEVSGVGAQSEEKEGARPKWHELGISVGHIIVAGDPDNELLVGEVTKLLDVV